jgi:hypothetical protein
VDGFYNNCDVLRCGHRMHCAARVSASVLSSRLGRRAAMCSVVSPACRQGAGHAAPGTASERACRSMFANAAMRPTSWFEQLFVRPGVGGGPALPRVARAALPDDHAHILDPHAGRGCAACLFPHGLTIGPAQAPQDLAMPW